MADERRIKDQDDRIKTGDASFIWMCLKVLKYSNNSDLYYKCKYDYAK